MANEKEKNDGGGPAVQEATVVHEMKPALKKFHDDQGKSKKEEAMVVVDDIPQVKRVQVTGVESGVYRVGNDSFAITKGQITVIPDYVADYLRERRKVV